MTLQATPDGADVRPTIPEVVDRLRATFATGRTRSREWRTAQLRGIERLCDEREDEIAAAIARDLRRDAFGAWLGEIAGTKAEAVHARRHLRRWMLPSLRPVPLTQLPGLASVRPEPLGTVLVIGPWNYPVYLSLSPLVAALAAGNTVAIKPSELAPACSALLAELLPQYVDPDAVAVVEGDAATTQELLGQGFDHALFTGGTEIGRKIMAAAAAHLTPVTLELGGKSPVIVDETADVEVAARRIAQLKLLNSGQTCIAPDYVLAHRSIRDDLVEQVAARLREFREGEPEAMPVVNPRQFDRLSKALAATRGRVAAGGLAETEQFSLQPTVVVDPDPDEPLMREEIFGPILPVSTFDTLGEAIARINAGDKPLAAYLFSSSRATRKRVIAEVPAGGIVVNHVAMHVMVPSLPFGGVGASGMGAYHGKTGFDTFSHRKAVLVKPSRPDPLMAYPPYTEKAQRFLRKMF